MKANSVFREYVRYTVFNVLGMIGLSCYILADTFFISKGMGANGLAALNLAIPVYSAIHGSGLMLGMGGATRYTILREQGDAKRANQVFTHTLYLAVVLAALFVSVGLFGSAQLTALLQADGDVFGMTNSYLRVLLLLSPAFLCNDILICFVRNDGDPRLSMTAMLVGSAANIVLDYVFIFPCGLGIFGAALATGISPGISALVLSRHIRLRRNRFHVCPGRVRPEHLRAIVTLGVPSLVTEISSGIVIIVFNLILLSLAGTVGVAAYGVIANVSIVAISVHTGIAQGMQPVASRAHGSGEAGQERRVLRYAIVTSLLLSAVIYLCAATLAEPITAVFNSEGNAQLQAIAVSGMRIYFWGILPAGCNIVLSLYFTSIERPRPAQMISLGRGLVVILPMAELLSSLGGLTGAWAAFPAAEALVLLLGIGRLGRPRAEA